MSPLCVMVIIFAIGMAFVVDHEAKKKRKARETAATPVSPPAPVPAVPVRAEAALPDWPLRESLAETRNISERAARNKLGYALDRVRKQENEARQNALSLDRRKRDDPAAIAAMTRAQSLHREAEQLAAELAQAEANVEQVQDFLDAVRAHHEDVTRTVATLRRRFEGAERRAALTQLSAQIQQRRAGVAELTGQIETYEAQAEAAWTAANLDPEQASIIAQGRLRRGDAAEELERLREQR